jgi:L-rhamnose mutarotase
VGRVEARRIIAGERAYAVIAGQDDAREGSMKSYAMALDLRDDAEVIERYKEYHRAVWDEVLEGLRSLGISKMKIFLRGSRLFMYLETPDDFDLERDFQRYTEASPRAAEWDALMREFQVRVPDAKPGEWWAAMEEVFDLYG